MTMTISLPRRAALKGTTLALAAALLLAGAPVAQALGNMVSVVVSSSSSAEAADAVTSVGGLVDSPLPIVDGVLARVYTSRIDELSTRAVVVEDRPIHVQSSSFGGNLVTAYPKETGATKLWNKNLTGKGVTVALVDTGIANVPDLAGRIIASADLSPELTFTDGYGHGTFEAGIIAGNGASSDGAYVGMAPQANLMSVRVAGSDGSTTLGKVLLGVQLVDSSADQFNVGVVLVALDSGSPLPPERDPLSRALRRLWADGVVVVVPAGNGGPDGEIASPGEDPMLLTVGSVNDMGTSDPTDDAVSGFSALGPTRWGADKPDVAAPGEHLVGLRVPGSTIDDQNPSARVDNAYFKGSGTSMSAAVTAGAAALLLSGNPDLTPDQVKASLMGSANAIPAGDSTSVGAGVINAADAVEAGAPDDLPDAPEERGKGRYDWPKFKDLDFEWFGNSEIGYRWLARQWAARQWAARQWATDAWEARQWAARQWADVKWDARQWMEDGWAARQWAARQWAARQWAARQWAARQWAARQWAARQWAARQWASEDWAARQWAARQWSADDWEARQWSARQWSDSEWAARQWKSESWSARQWSARQWSARQWSNEQWEARQWSARQWSGSAWVARQWSARSWG